MADYSTSHGLQWLRRICPGGWLLVILVLMIFAPMLLVNLRVDLQPWRIADDVLQQIPPFYRFAPDDPALVEDYLCDYYLDCYPVGFKSLYATAARWAGDPRPLSKILPYVLLGAFLLIMSLGAYRLGGWPLVIALLLVMLSANGYLGRMGGGLPRAFGYVTTALALGGLVYGRWPVILAAVVLGAAFYPATGFFAGICLGLYALGEPQPLWKTDWRGILRCGAIVATGAVAGFALLWPVMQRSNQYGEIITADDVEDYPEIGPEGRYLPVDRELPPGRALFELLETAPSVLVGQSAVDAAVSPLHGVMNREWIPGQPLRPINLVILALTALAGWGGYRRLRARDAAYTRLFYAAGALALALALAMAVTPHLYLPYRYIRYCWGPLYLLLLFGGLQGLRPMGAELCPWAWRDWLRFFSSPPVVAAVLLFGLVGSLGGWQRRIDASPQMPALDFLRTEAGPGLVAGWPGAGRLVELVPYYSRRPVLVNYEVHQIFHRNYVDELRRRMNLLVDAFAGADPAALRALHERYNVRYLLFETPEIGPPTQPLTYMAPFDQRIAAQYRSGSGPDLAEFVDSRPQSIVFQNETDTIVDLEILLKQFQTPDQQKR